MFSKRSSVELTRKIPKWTTMMTDNKLDHTTRISYLRKILEHSSNDSITNLFSTYHADIFFIFYEEFYFLENNLKNKGGLRGCIDYFAFLCHILKMILICIPMRIKSGWNYHAIHYLIRKMIHPMNYPKVRSFGIELCIIWIGCIQNVHDKYSSILFAVLFNDISPQFKSINTNVPDDYFTYEKLDQYLTGVSTTQKINPNEVFLFWESVIPFASINLEKVPSTMTQKPHVYVERFLEYIAPSALIFNVPDDEFRIQYFESILDVMRVYIINNLFHISPLAVNKYFLSPEDFEIFRETTNIDERLSNEILVTSRELISKWIISFFLFRDSKTDIATPTNPRTDVECKSPKISPEMAQSSLESTLSEDHPVISKTELDQQKEQCSKLFKSSVFRSYHNFILVLEVFRYNVSSFDCSYHNKKNIAFMFDSWCVPSNTPSCVSSDPNVTDVPDFNTPCCISLPRFHRILIYIIFLPFYSKYVNEYFIDAIPCLKNSLSFVRSFAAFRADSINSETWDALIRILIDVFSRLINISEIKNCKNTDETSSLAMFISYFFQTLFLVWLRGNIYTIVSIESWNSFTRVLQKCPHIPSLFNQWMVSIDIITRLYCFDSFNVDLFDLPLDKETDTRRKIKAFSQARSPQSPPKHRLTSSIAKFVDSFIIPAISTKRVLQALKIDETSGNSSKKIISESMESGDHVLNTQVAEPLQKQSSISITSEIVDEISDTQSLNVISSDDKTEKTVDSLTTIEEVSRDSVQINSQISSLDSENLHQTQTSYMGVERNQNLLSPEILYSEDLSDLDNNSNQDDKFSDISQTTMALTENHLFLLWRRFIGIFGKINEINNEEIQVAILKVFYKIFERLEDVAKNQGITSDFKYIVPDDTYHPLLQYFIPFSFEIILNNQTKQNSLIFEAQQLLLRSFFTHYNLKYIPNEMVFISIDIFSNILQSNNIDQILQFFHYSTSIMSKNIKGLLLVVKPLLKGAHKISSLKMETMEMATTLLSLCPYFFNCSSLNLHYDTPNPFSDLLPQYINLIVKGATSSKQFTTRCIYLSCLNQIIIEHVFNKTDHTMVKFFLTILFKHIYCSSISVSQHVCSLISCYPSYSTLFEEFDPEILNIVLIYICDSLGVIQTQHKKYTPNPSLYNMLITILNIMLEILFKKPLKHNIRKVFDRLNFISRSSVEYCISDLYLYPSLYSPVQLPDIDSELLQCLNVISNPNIEVSQTQTSNTIKSPLIDVCTTDISESNGTDREHSYYVQIQYTADFCLILLNNFPLPPGSTVLFSRLNESEFFESCDDDSVDCFISCIRNTVIISVCELSSDKNINENIKPYLKPFSSHNQAIVLFRTPFGKFSWIISECFDQFRKIISGPIQELKINKKSLVSWSNTDNLFTIVKDLTEKYPESLKKYPYNIPDLPLLCDIDYQKKIKERLLTFQPKPVHVKVESTQAQFDTNCKQAFKYKLFTQLSSQLGYFMSENRQHISIIEPSARFFRDARQIDNRYIRSTHKIAIFYAKHGQEDKESILQNVEVSTKFSNFISGLGWMVDLEKHHGFMGGLDKGYSKGCSTIYYCSLVNEVIFHVSPLMPVGDATTNGLISKLRHLGNDEVHIVWSEHFRPFRRGIINTEFGDVIIVIYPLPNELYKINILTRTEIKLTGPLIDGSIVSFKMLPILVRETAINASHSIRMNHELYKISFEDRLHVIQQLNEKYSSKISFEQYLSFYLSKTNPI